jgi:hypothetical protein
MEMRTQDIIFTSSASVRGVCPSFEVAQSSHGDTTFDRLIKQVISAISQLRELDVDVNAYLNPGEMLIPFLWSFQFSAFH